MRWLGPEEWFCCQAYRGLTIGFLLLLYSVVCTVESLPRGYKTWVHSQTQNIAQWLAACGHVSASNHSFLIFVLSSSSSSSSHCSSSLGWPGIFELLWDVHVPSEKDCADLKTVYVKSKTWFHGVFRRCRMAVAAWRSLSWEEGV